MGKSEKQDRNTEPKGSETKVKRDDDLQTDVDDLFRLPSAEFTGARNALAARLKKSARGEEKAEAARVKVLSKPSVSAWAVNQLYWNHREAFDRLIASGERFHKAQASHGGGKIADMRTALDARRDALTHLTDLATSLLRDAGPNPGQNPSSDTIHRVTTTLEGLSAYASRSDGPQPGRLTHDVDPPGFESFGAFVPAAGFAKAQPMPSPKSSSVVTNTRGKVATDHDVRQVGETRKAKIAAARVSLRDAKKSLTVARARAQSLEATQKKAQAEAKAAEKERRDAEERFEKASSASEDASRRARVVAVEVEEAVSALHDAERTVEKVSSEIEKLLGE
jgi:hypothetical protein